MKTYRVGGCVRDMLRGVKPHDVDYVVVGSTPDEMRRLGFKSVGRDFPVFLHPETHEEYALARREIKTGPKHTDFRFVFGPEISLEEDLRRRDFTCNAVAFDPEKNEFIDFCGGIEDIGNKILRHVDSEHFREDPLRVLRLCRFTAQLEFEPAPETVALAGRMAASGMLAHLTAERVWKELEKALSHPAFYRFVEAARACGALSEVLPEVNRLWGVPEKKAFHPEGNTGAHTLLALKKALSCSPEVRFAVLTHDLGKALTPTDRLPSHHEHEEKGIALIQGICQRLKVPNAFRDFALTVCRHHMKFSRIPQMKASTLMDLVEELTPRNLEGFIAACRCDSEGRGAGMTPEQAASFERSAALLRAVQGELSKMKATDVPGFEHMEKDRHFGEIYRKFRLERLKSAVPGLKRSPSPI
jgi:tRNA nucleotidyltransferase (CCA-adding enzyme)